MAGTLNKVMLIGYVGRDPEVRGVEREYCAVSVATSERWRDRETGDKRERTDWHRVVVFNEHLIGVVQRYVRKGSKVYIEGQLVPREWTDRNGDKKRATEVVLSGPGARLSLIDKVEADADREQGDVPAAKAPAPVDDDIPL
jgi:single-strand DNA-binding protein